MNLHCFLNVRKESCCSLTKGRCSLKEINCSMTCSNYVLTKFQCVLTKCKYVLTELHSLLTKCRCLLTPLGLYMCQTLLFDKKQLMSWVLLLTLLAPRCILLTPPMFVVRSTRFGKQLVACTCFLQVLKLSVSPTSGWNGYFTDSLVSGIFVFCNCSMLRSQSFALIFRE